MLRLACFFLIAATIIGALMPSHKSTAPVADKDGIIYTPQSSGSSYRVANNSGSDDQPLRSGKGHGAVKLDRAGADPKVSRRRLVLENTVHMPQLCLSQGNSFGQQGRRFHISLEFLGIHEHQRRRRIGEPRNVGTG